MTIALQPTLENEQIVLQPLKASDFETLYAVASDPEIWQQHPNKDRWKKDVFRTFFEGAMQSGGAWIRSTSTSAQPTSARKSLSRGWAP